MAARRKKKATRKTARKPARKARGRGKKSAVDLIISKARTKAFTGINVSGEFYSALDVAVRSLIQSAEQRAVDNGRKTLRPYDL